IRRKFTPPGPQWATGGETETERRGSEAKGILSEACSVSARTDSNSVSVRFQKDFQKSMSRFWVIRSNSAPLSSGSITYFPDFSPKDTMLMTTVCRNGLIVGENFSHEEENGKKNKTHQVHRYREFLSLEQTQERNVHTCHISR
uniref:Uncharacterized protein n=1 Tax=Denticeps clupeoides TaxID=299321 RepID=A0AAY4DNN4_9TELE